MTRIPFAAALFTASLVALVPLSTVRAQSAAPGPTAAVAAPAAQSALEPFIASYSVFNEGKALGAATMQVVQQPSNRWRVDLNMRGTKGLLSLAGISAEQSTVFDTIGGGYRPLTQATVRGHLFGRKQTVGVYHWGNRSARWSGDVKETRRAPVALRAGDMSGLLINLAVIRDAEPGKSLHYRFVDDGRVREHNYVVANDMEDVAVGGLSFKAMRVSRVESGNEETVIWVASGVPTPIRMLQRENGRDTYDLRLLEYR